MDVNQVKQELERLRAEITAANDAYYNQDDPLMEDFEYDALTRRLRELEAQFPQLAAADSPIGRIGGEASALFAPVEHAVVMESLQDVFSFEELEDFDRRVCGAVTAPRYVVEPKVDGLSISLEYRDGVFVRGSTRGDGRTGEDVTANLMTIRDIPKKIAPAPQYLEVRAEVYMPKSVFAELVAAQDENGETAFKNPRNAAAGSLRQKDSTVTASRGLSIVAFNVQQIDGVEMTSHSQSLDYLKKLGFPVSQYHLADR
ncbi:MAG: NAD-dependent DNA ligase LigA, partial [Clostridia bacterium]|nr:NAD-dependent DNA ligase LigA [Clostridia bacterium]